MPDGPDPLPEPLPPSVLPLDWHLVAALARQHRLTPLLAMGLRHTGLQGVDPEFLESIELEHQRHFRRNLFLTTEWFTIWKLLDDHGIPCLCFKGPALASEAYGYLGARTFEDLDIFVPSPEEAKRAKDLLLERGYSTNDQLHAIKEKFYQQTQCEYQLSKPDQRLFIDLHWQIFQDFFSFPFPVVAAWKRLTSVSIGSREFPSFCPEDMLLILCAHGTKHGWAHLGHIADIAWLIAKKFPPSGALWKNVVQLARSMKSRRMLNTGLALAHELFQVSLPESIQEAIAGDRTCRMLRRQAIRRLTRGAQDHLPFWEHLVLSLRSRENWTTRWRFCLKGIFVPSLSDYSWVPLPDWLFPLYYALRPIRIVLDRLSGR